MMYYQWGLGFLTFNVSCEGYRMMVKMEDLWSETCVILALEDIEDSSGAWFGVRC